MPNPYFRFKQFTVNHDRCAMKVGTDGVLLGAWADITGAQRILDIGTGSGLVALMLAQRISTANKGNVNKIVPTIDAVEMELAATEQAAENVNLAPWPDWIQLHHDTIQSYAASCQRRYDLIVSNPPFFSGEAVVKGLPRSVARHTHELIPETLIKIADRLLTDGGRLCVVYPVAQAEKLVETALQSTFTLRRTLYVKPTPTLPTKRILVDLERLACVHSGGLSISCSARSQDSNPMLMSMKETIALEVARHSYTPEFVDLIRDFYLKY